MDEVYPRLWNEVYWHTLDYFFPAYITVLLPSLHQMFETGIIPLALLGEVHTTFGDWRMGAPLKLAWNLVPYLGDKWLNWAHELELSFCLTSPFPHDLLILTHSIFSVLICAIICCCSFETLQLHFPFRWHTSLYPSHCTNTLVKMIYQLISNGFTTQTPPLNGFQIMAVLWGQRIWALKSHQRPFSS